MGLDGTIKRSTSAALGPLTDVQRVLAAMFPGITFGTSPSGAEKIRIAAERGVVFPEIIRKHLESSPPMHGAVFDAPTFSIEFQFGATDLVQEIAIVIRGKTVDSEPILAKLEEQYGWVTSHP